MAHGPSGWTAGGSSPAPLWWRPEVCAPLLAAIALFSVGWWRLREMSARAAPVAQILWYAAGIGAAALALLSPIDGWAEASFLAHMVQHLLLVKIAAPALLLANPLAAMLWSLPPWLRVRAGVALAPGAPLRAIWRALTRAPVAWTLYLLTLWLWHVPAAWEAALGDRAVHDLEHLAFFGAAVLFWWPLIRPAPHVGPALRPGTQVVYLVLAAFQEGALGLFLAFAPRALYPSYAGRGAFGLGPLEDQAWGGIVMWGVGGAIDMIAVLVLLWRAMGGGAAARGRGLSVSRSCGVS